MNKKIILLVMMLMLSGCSSTEPQSSGIDSGKLEVESINKLQSSANIKLDLEYDFAYSDQVVGEYPTFDNTNPITISASDELEITLYGSKAEITDIASAEMVASVNLDANSSYTYDNAEGYTYFKIVAKEPGEAVLSTIR
ncbi:hypothetical protein RZE82_00850 [Mollicutes bacterium LVI A0039]|nr:hypothetical protein RZE82_00850 [Mollicutes bacterium LVI A0039]